MDIIAIAGGSGSGKSTIAYHLEDAYPQVFEVFNLDDYQKVEGSLNLPKRYGKINWDHPDIIDWEKALKDISTLQKGEDVIIRSWAHRSNPDYFKHNNMVTRKIRPKKILIVEGYFALFDARLRKLYKRSYYLDINIKESIKRRKKFDDAKYDKKILISMHKKYVEPTKKHASLVIDTSKLDIPSIFKKIDKDLQNYFPDDSAI